MRLVRQPRKKENSIQLPATSLHLMQVSKFIEEYLHCQQKYLINLSAAAVHTHLPLREHDPSFDIDLNVPYIESQHYDSHATFTDQPKDLDSNSQTLTKKEMSLVKSWQSKSKGQSDLQDENFTDRQGSNSISSESEEVSCRQRKTMQDEEQEEEKFGEDDFKFVKHAKSSADMVGSLTIGTDRHNSTKQSRQIADRPLCLPIVEEAELHHLQETAYFLQERDRVERRLLFESQQQQNVPSMNQPYKNQPCMPSKKAIFLSKIEKEKSRKEIAQAINRERHHIKKFLK